MPEALEREVTFDIGPALSSLQDLDREFEQSAQRMQQTYSDALEAALSGVVIEEVDAQPVTEAVTEAIESGADTVALVDEADADAVSAAVGAAIDEGADDPAVVTGDASDVTDAIDTAIDAADPNVEIVGVADDVTDAIDTAIDAADTEVAVAATVEMDTTEAEDAIADLESLAQEAAVEIPVSADTTEAQQSFDELGESAAGGAAGLGILGGAAAGAQAKMASAGASGGIVAGALTKIGPAGIAASGGVAIAAASFADLVSTGAEVLEVTDQFQDTFGDFADEVSDIDVAGLNSSLEDLSISLGTDDEALLAATTRAGAFAKTLGLGADETAKFAEQVVALGAFVSSVNPSLGTIDTVVGQIARTLSRSPQGLGRLGLDVPPERIAELAAQLGKVPEQLSRGELAALAAQAAIDGIGDVSDEVARRQDNAGVKVRAFREQISDLKEEIAVQVAIPVLDALEEFTPVLRSLTPLAKLFGQAIALAFKGFIAPIQSAIKLIGGVAVALGNFIEEANQIAFVGRAIPDDIGDNIRDWGEGAIESANGLVEAGTAASGVADAATEVEAAGPGAAAGMQQMTGAAQELTPAQQAAADAIEEFASAALAALPSTAAAFDAWDASIVDAYKNVLAAHEEGPEKVQQAQDALVRAADPARLIESLQKQAQQVRDFTTNIQTLIDAGFTNVVNELVRRGPEASAALADSLVDNQANAAALETTLDDIDAAYSDYATVIRGPQGQKVVVATSDVFTEAAGGVPAAYNIAELTAQEFNAAVAAIQAANPKVSAETAASAVSADQAFAARFLPSQSALAEMGAAGNTIRANAPTVAAAGAGQSTTGEFGTNLQFGRATRAEMQAAAQELFSTGTLGVAARSAGRGVGFDFVLGIQAGIQNNDHLISQAAEEAVRAAERAARRAANAQSPSKLFAKLGEDLAAGLAEGLAADDPVQVAEQIVADLAAVINNASLPSLQIGTAGVAAGALAVQPTNVAGTQTNSFQFDVSVAVNGSLTQTQARTVGAQIADSAAAQLRRRDVIARVRAAV